MNEISTDKIVVALLDIHRQLTSASSNLGNHDCFEAAELDEADQQIAEAKHAVGKLIYSLDPASWQKMKDEHRAAIAKGMAELNEVQPGAVTPEYLAYMIDSVPAANENTEAGGSCECGAPPVSRRGLALGSAIKDKINAVKNRGLECRKHIPPAGP